MFSTYIVYCKQIIKAVEKKRYRLVKIKNFTYILVRPCRKLVTYYRNLNLKSQY